MEILMLHKKIRPRICITDYFRFRIFIFINFLMFLKIRLKYLNLYLMSNIEPSWADFLERLIYSYFSPKTCHFLKIFRYLVSLKMSFFKIIIKQWVFEILIFVIYAKITSCSNFKNWVKIWTWEKKLKTFQNFQNRLMRNFKVWKNESKPEANYRSLCWLTKL